MIYDFPQPVIVDTKNIHSTFTKKKYVPKEYIPKIKKINQTRKGVKKTLKYLTSPKISETPPYNLFEEVIEYGNNVSELGSIYEKEYAISKNWKWSPILTQIDILKFGQSIKFGKSGEIIMARYAAFSVCFRNVKDDIAFFKTNLLQKNQVGLVNDLTFSTLMAKDPIVSKLEVSIEKILRAHEKAWRLLKKYSLSSSTYFKNLASYSEKYIENKPEGMDICLLLTSMNANMLYIEYLRFQANYGEMGKYAKMIVTQSVLIEEIAKMNGFLLDSKLVEHLKVTQKLYKALSLWSLYFVYLPQLQTHSFTDGMDFNVLGNGSVSFIDRIARLHREVLEMPGIKLSPLYGVVCLYFTDVFIPKCKEVQNAYGQIFEQSTYDELHFNKIDELDYLERAIGDSP